MPQDPTFHKRKMLLIEHYVPGSKPPPGMAWIYVENGVLKTMNDAGTVTTYTAAPTGGLNYLGTWDADANDPELTDGSGANGDYYVVDTAGTTEIDGEDSWGIGDWIISNGTAWQKIDNSETAFPDISGKLDASANLSDVSDAATSLSNIGGLPIARLDEIWIGAGAMIPRTTNGAASATIETATNDRMLDVLDFDQTTEEGASFCFTLPQAWNDGTVKAKVYWLTTDTTTGGVAWGIRGGAVSNDDVLDAAYGTEQVVVDNNTVAGDLLISSATSAITLGGTPAAGDLLMFEITREVANGSDNSAYDARLVGVQLQITNDTLNAAW